MTTSAEQILEMWRTRVQSTSTAMQRMDEIRRAYNGDLVLPLPQMDKVEKAAVANLIQQGIDQLGARISSVKPDVDFPSENPGQALADKRARQRRMAVLGWWDKNIMTVLDGRRARHLLAYASSPVLIRPGHSYEHGVPTWHVRNPMGTFPGPRPNPDDMTPNDCIFRYEATLQFLMHRYPEQAARLEKGPNPTPDTRFDILEYVDDAELVMVAVGREPPTPGYGPQSYIAGAPLAELVRNPNRAGMCTVVIPHRTSLDLPIGKFDGMTGMYQMQARLMALTLIAVERSVFPQEWLVGRPGELPEVLVEADSKNGRTGVVTGGMLEEHNLNPSGVSMQMAAMLEANQRQQGGLPQEFGGESPTNVRTGRRGADIMSAQVDFPIQEAQTLLARSKEYENMAAIAVAKGWYGNKQVSFYVRKMKGASGQVTYRPNEIFTTDVNFVEYPHAGSDANQLAVLIGQLVGLQLISEDTARQLHPLIDDPHHEKEYVVAEALEKALVQAVSTQVGQGTLSAVDVAKIISTLEQDKGTLAEAVTAVHEAEQERQAGLADQQSPAGGAPGLAPGPGGAPGGAAIPPGGPPSVGPPTPSESNLAQLLSTLHAPPQQVAGAA